MPRPEDLTTSSERALGAILENMDRATEDRERMFEVLRSIGGKLDTLGPIPDKVRALEHETDRLKEWKNRANGAIALVVAVLTIIGGFFAGLGDFFTHAGHAAVPPGAQ